MKNNITELVFILDRSGSMANLARDTIGGFNSLIEKQKKKDGKCFVTTVLFDTRFETLHDRVPLESVAPMTDEEYTPGGCTALLDAMGDTIRHIAAIHKYARPEDVPENTIFVITTDGLENASRRFGTDEIRRMVDHERDKYGWQFVLLGANIDAFAAAASIGIRPEQSANFHADADGMRLSFEAVDNAVSAVRMSMPVCGNWKESVEADYKNRKMSAKQN